MYKANFVANSLLLPEQVTY